MSPAEALVVHLTKEPAWPESFRAMSPAEYSAWSHARTAWAAERSRLEFLALLPTLEIDPPLRQVPRKGSAGTNG